MTWQEHSQSCCNYQGRLLRTYYVLNIYLFIYLLIHSFIHSSPEDIFFHCFQRKERERERESEREKHWLVASCKHPNWGNNPHPGYVPWLGVKPANSQFIGWHSIQLSHTGQGITGRFKCEDAPSTFEKSHLLRERKQIHEKIGRWSSSSFEGAISRREKSSWTNTTVQEEFGLHDQKGKATNKVKGKRPSQKKFPYHTGLILIYLRAPN